ncbi:MAG: dnaE2, partial [Phycisphaerales bacterium]|nr:dnaE2 [Phycisphaerales bacterium]
RAADLPPHAVERLAGADALAGLGLTRRTALWHALALAEDDAPLFAGLLDKSDVLTRPDTAAFLPPMPVGQEVMADYATAGLSLKRHPVSLLRAALAARGVLPAAKLAAVSQGRWVRVAGLVLVRQRPGTAGGIVFQTLEDETGVANLIVYPDVYDRFRAAARHATLLQADGRVEKQGQVIHVLAYRLHDLTELLADEAGPGGGTGRFASRDFH